MTKLQRRMALIAALIALALAPAILEAQNVIFPERQGASSATEAKRLIAVLGSDAATFEKARAAQQLAILGDKEAIPALAALLGDEKLAAYARSGLESIADPAAGDALRKALGKVKGKLLIGVINSIGVRRDAKAVAALGELAAKGSDVAGAALMALGRIATPEAAEILLPSLDAQGAAIRAVAADAASLRRAANDRGQWALGRYVVFRRGAGKRATAFSRFRHLPGDYQRRASRPTAPGRATHVRRSRHVRRSHTPAAGCRALR